MPGETDLHRTLKKEACRWLLRMGYRCIAAEVRLPPLGIVDAVGTGVFRAYHNYLGEPREMAQVCFIEAKASRADFLRDGSEDGQLSLCLMERKRNLRKKTVSDTILKARKTVSDTVLRQAVGLGKFSACIAQPMANLHYIIAPVGVLQKNDLPPRWGLLTYGSAGVCVTVRAAWQESAACHYAEGAIARTLTGDIYRADDRAINSVNREIFAQQQQLATRIKAIKENIVLADREERMPDADLAETRVESYSRSIPAPGRFR